MPSTSTWTSNSNTVWETSGNWTPTAPNPGDTVVHPNAANSVFAGPVASITLGALTLLDSTATFLVDGLHTLSVSGNVSINDYDGVKLNVVGGTITITNGCDDLRVSVLNGTFVTTGLIGTELHVYAGTGLLDLSDPPVNIEVGPLFTGTLKNTGAAVNLNGSKISQAAHLKMQGSFTNYTVIAATPFFPALAMLLG